MPKRVRKKKVKKRIVKNTTTLTKIKKHLTAAASSLDSASKLATDKTTMGIFFREAKGIRKWRDQLK